MATVTFKYGKKGGRPTKGVMYRIHHLGQVAEVSKDERDRVTQDLATIKRMIKRHEDSGIPYTCREIADEFRVFMEQGTLSRFVHGVVEMLKSSGREGTAEKYLRAVKSFTDYLGESDITLEAMTPEKMEGYAGWLKSRGLMLNTQSFSMRTLRAIYRRAVDAGIVTDAKPFRRTYTGLAKTTKRALPLTMIRRIKVVPLDHGTMAYARDMFLLSFYLRGMSFVDMAYLRKTDLRDGRLVYRRHKTGQLLTIAWTDEMQAILDRLPPNDGEYLLPVIMPGTASERTAYQTASARINHALKRVGKLAGLEVPLTMYVARHSWASIMRAEGVPLQVISDGLGHDNEETTRIYLASLDTGAVDRANARVIHKLQ